MCFRSVLVGKVVCWECVSGEGGVLGEEGCVGSVLVGKRVCVV